MACIVNITGTGAPNYCYATVNGTIYISAISGITLTSDTITFGVRRRGDVGGSVTIDGEVVYSLSSAGLGTYEWTVPDNVKQVDITLSYSSDTTGSITVSTVKDAVTAHKTMVDGAAYEITGGKVMVGGTVYDIAGGKTLVDGTVYEIAFAPSTITVNITGEGRTLVCYAEINGTEYSDAATIEIERGTSIYVKVNPGVITLNGEKVAISTVSSNVAEYTFTPDCNVVNINLYYSSREGTIEITTS